MSILFYTVRGRPENVLSSVCRRISAFTRTCNICNFKIGITNNPQRRWQQAYAGSYDDMLVVYQSSSIRFVSKMEYDLINHNWDYCDNIISGGGGAIGSTSPYYLYVVRKH